MDAMPPIEIRRIENDDAASFRACLDAVARERRWLAQVEAPPLAQVRQFVADSVQKDAAQYVAVRGEEVVGWCDIFAHWAHALQHVGVLGMGVQAGCRGLGLGRRLLDRTLAHALRQGIYRVTLEAREDNHRAIRLYKAAGFRHEGRAACAMRFDGTFFTGVAMARLQGPAADAAAAPAG